MQIRFIAKANRGILDVLMGARLVGHINRDGMFFITPAEISGVRDYIDFALEDLEALITRVKEVKRTGHILPGRF